MKNKINFRLIAITDRKLVNGDLLKRVKNLSLAGVRAIQLREKDMTSKEKVELGRAIRKVTKKRSKLIINDRADIALLSGAYGVHSTASGLSSVQISKISSSLIKGKSVHSLSEALSAQREGFDYLMFGPIYRTPAKVKFGAPQGLKKLSEFCSKVNIPVFAVGGINPARAKKCINSGAYGVAVIRDLMRASNIKKKINEYRKSLGDL